MGFLVTDIMILHLVHWNDPDVRSYVYGMMAATMSIFCAVLLNQAVSSFIVEQILKGEGHRGLGIKDVEPWMHAMVGAFLFTSFFTALNVLCYKFRDQPKYLTGVEDIGAHITAFAGVKFFGWLQYWEVQESSQQSAYGTLVFAVLVIALFGVTASKLRWRRRTIPSKVAAQASETHDEGYVNLGPALLAGGEAAAAEGSGDEEGADSEVGSELKDAEEAPKAKPEWISAVHKAENEATAIILSFLAAQAIIFAITGVLHMEGEEEKGPAGAKGPAEENWDHRSKHIRRLFWSSLVTLALLFVTTYLTSGRERAAKGAANGESELGDKRSRCLNLWEMFLAMLQSWTTMRVAYWMMRKLFHEKHQSQVATAGAVTFLAVLCIIVLDKIADRINAEGDKRAEAAPAASQLQALPQQRWREALEGESSSQSSSEESDTEAEAGMFSKGYPPFQLPQLPQLPKAVTPESFYQLRHRASKMVNSKMPIPPDHERGLEKALRTVIVGLSLLVGLCWEKAFDAADEALMEGFEFAHDHQVISKTVMAIFNVAVVFPAWLKFMVPMAKMNREQHEKMMDLENDTPIGEMSRANAENFARATELLSNLSPEELIDATSKTLKNRSDAAEMLKKLQAALEKEE